MSEPITIYCVTAHEWGARQYQPRDAMTLYAPSFVREMLTSGRWSLEEPVFVREMLTSGRWSFEAPAPVQAPVVVAPVEAPVVAPAPAQPVTPKRKPRRL